MAFFARPNLDDTQFKQLEGSLLSLSGQTQIATPTGLTLTDGSGGNIPVTASGASTPSSNFDVLTYCDGIISLMPSSASGGTGIYDGLSPSTCSVGGLSAGTTIYGSGYTAILQSILVPNIPPVIVNQSASFSITPSTLLYEIGTVINLTGCASFNSGCIIPLYPSGSTCCVGRSCGASGYSYNIFGPATGVTLSCFPSNSCVFPSHPVTPGNNTVSAIVYYSGGTQPYYSDCVTTFGSALSAGCETPPAKTICGIYPIYYGKVPSGARPAVTNDLVTGGTKTVEPSTGTVEITFGSVGEYTWLAIPSGSTSKTCWYVNPSNNGCIATSVADKYPDECILGIVSGQGCWGISPIVGYKVYMSKTFWTDPDPIEFRNS